MSIISRGGAVAAALCTVAVGAAVATPAQAAPVPGWACSATAINLLNGGTVSTVGSPTSCDPTDTGRLDVGPALGVVEAATAFAPGHAPGSGGIASGRSDIVRSDLSVGGLFLSVRDVHSLSTTACAPNVDGPSISSFGYSILGSVFINGKLIATGTAPRRIVITPFVTLWLNRQLELRDGLTQRALELDVLGQPVAILGETSSRLTDASVGCKASSQTD